MEGWVLISHETDEFYGLVQWRNESGVLIDKKQPIQKTFSDNTKYMFCNCGLGELIIVK